MRRLDDGTKAVLYCSKKVHKSHRPKVLSTKRLKFSKEANFLFPEILSLLFTLAAAVVRAKHKRPLKAIMLLSTPMIRKLSQ